MSDGQDTDSLLGTILVRSAAVPADDVARALEQQRGGDGRNLGELLVEAGLAPLALLDALEAQGSWREGDVPRASRAIGEAGARRAQRLADEIIELANA